MSFEGWPDKIDLGLADQVVEVAKRIGHFLNPLRSPQGYLSDYPKHPERGAAAMLDRLSPTINEPTDGEAYQPPLPFDKQRAVEHYTAMAEEARQQKEGWDSLGCYIVKSEYEG